MPPSLRRAVRSIDDLTEFLKPMDIIYVGGGNTANMLNIWRLHEFDSALLAAHRNGTILSGISAGAACWFESCVTDSFGSLKPLNDGLGIISGRFCPHYNSEPGRPEVYSDLVARKQLPPGIGLDDGIAVRYRGGVIVESFRSSEDAHVHFINLESD